MHVMGNLMDHVRLVSRMATTTGADIVRAREVGDMSQAEWAGMVQVCRRCGWAGPCADWLDRHEPVADAPGQCPNRATFGTLRAQGQRCERDEV